MFLNPIGFLALAAIPVVVILHRYRKRAQPKVVSARFLWGPSDRSESAGRRRVPLQKNWPMWMEILSICAMSIALAQPAGCTPEAAPHLVAVLDTSASMNADMGDSSPLEKAKKFLEEEIRSLPMGSTVSLVETGDPPGILAGPQADPGEALRSLSGVSANGGSNNPELALSLAQGLSRKGGILWLTDTVPATPPADNIEWKAFGSPAGNVGIVRASRSEQGLRTSVTISSHGGALTGKLQIGDGKEIWQTKNWETQEGKALVLGFGLDQNPEKILIEIIPDGPDAIEIDNKIWLLKPKPRQIRLAADISEEKCRLLGLKSGKSAIGKWLKITPNSVETPPELAHLIITDKGSGGNTDTWKIRILDTSGKLSSGSVWWDRTHPFLKGIDLSGMNWIYGDGRKLRGQALIEAKGKRVMTEEIFQNDRRLVQLDIDIRRSNLQKSAAWPIILRNISEARRDMLPGLESKNLKSGETLTFRAATIGQWIWISPSRKTRIDHEKGTLQLKTGETGVHSIRHGEEEYFFSVNLLDPLESNLMGLSQGESEVKISLAAMTSGQSAYVALFALFALFLYGVDWRLTRIKK